MLKEKKQQIIEEYLLGNAFNNIPVKCKVKESEVHEVLKEYHDLKELFYLDRYDCWICPATLENNS